MPRSCKLIDQLLQIDGLLGTLVGMNGHLALGIDAEVAFAPVYDFVDVQSVLEFPLVHQFHQENAS